MRDRQSFLAEFDVYRPADMREAAMAAQLRDFAAGNVACFERTLATGHVTGSAWIVDRTGSAALLTHHRKLGKWLQLGGHADGEADIRAVALREAREESGLRDIAFARDEIYDVDVHPIPARGDEPGHVHYDVRFAFFARLDETPVCGDESHAVAWIPLWEIEDYAIDDSVRRLVAKTPLLLRPAAR